MSYEDEIVSQFLDGWEEELMGRRRRGRAAPRRGAPRRGAPRRGAPRPSASFKGQAAGVKATVPTEGRLLSLGLDSVAAVAAATQATVNAQPQVVFRPDRLVIPLAVAVDFLVNDLKIGKNSMFISAVGVPAEAFAHDASGVGLKMDTAQVSQIIAITVTNLDAVNPHRFTAALIGPSVE